MKNLLLSGSLRENVGKKDAKALRNQERVPCVLYGGEKQVHFSLTQKQFAQLIFTPEVFVIELTLNNETVKVILQDIQYHPVSDLVIHADFLQITEGKAVTVSLPTAFEGASIGVLAGGRLEKKMRKIRVKGLIENLPEGFTIDIEPLAIGDSVRVKDLSIEGVEFLDVPGSVIVAVKTARGADLDEDEGEEGEEGEDGEEGEEEKPAK